MRRIALAALAALAGCPDGDPECEATPSWAHVGRDVDGAALSIQGRADDDLWVVGGGRGAGPLAAHWDGTQWTRRSLQLDPDHQTWWWSWTSPGGTTWLVGDRDVIGRIDAAGAEELVALGMNGTFFGVWGAADADVWIVGTDERIVRWNGSAFEALAPPIGNGADLFKVWGTAADDVWISGERGTMLHWTGAGFTDHSAELATFAPALTVHGCSATEVYAVAGQALFAWDGVRWARRAEPVLGSAANGVSCGEDGVLVVGNAGLKRRWERASGAGGPWLDERSAPPNGTDLHGAWFDPAGRVWAAGGNFNDPSDAPRRGVVGVRGCPLPGAL